MSRVFKNMGGRPMNMMDAIKSNELKKDLGNGLIEYKEFYSTGQAWFHYFKLNGKLHGECKCWHSDGQLYIHKFYKNKELHGELKRWYYNGQLYEHTLWENGEIIKDYLI